jgi:hypothetical protein
MIIFNYNKITQNELHETRNEKIHRHFQTETN